MAACNRSDNKPRSGPKPRKRRQHRTGTSSTSERKVLPSSDSYETEGNEVLLAKSLQSFSQKLVEYLPFKQSGLPDSLIDECLTEDECHSIRELPTRKDQVRCLLRLMKGRSYSVMHCFLLKIELHWSKTLYNDIMTKYKDLVHEAQISRLRGSRYMCFVCRLKGDVNIKYVIDKMWYALLVSDALYEDIRRSTTHAGNQDPLWNRLLQECEENNGRKELFQALSRNGYYTHLVIGLRDMLDSGKRISECACSKLATPKVNEQMLLEYPSESTCSPASSDQESDVEDHASVKSGFTCPPELDTSQSQVSRSISVTDHRTSSRRESTRWFYRFIYLCRPVHPEPENW